MDNALKLAMLEDPKYGYMTLLNNRCNVTMDKADDEVDASSSECDRANCKNASAPLSMQTGLEKPVCAQCFDKARVSFAGIEEISVPGYTMWARMIKGWFVDNPKLVMMTCWFCIATLDT